MASPPGLTDTAELLLTMVVELAELRQQLAQAQDHLIEIAVDAGRLHARNEDLRVELTRTRAERDAWRTEAMRAQCA